MFVVHTILICFLCLLHIVFPSCIETYFRLWEQEAGRKFSPSSCVFELTTNFRITVAVAVSILFSCWISIIEDHTSWEPRACPVGPLRPSGPRAPLIIPVAYWFCFSFALPESLAEYHISRNTGDSLNRPPRLKWWNKKTALCEIVGRLTPEMPQRSQTSTLSRMIRFSWKLFCVVRNHPNDTSINHFISICKTFLSDKQSFRHEIKRNNVLTFNRINAITRLVRLFISTH